MQFGEKHSKGYSACPTQYPPHFTFFLLSDHSASLVHTAGHHLRKGCKLTHTSCSPNPSQPQQLED